MIIADNTQNMSLGIFSSFIHEVGHIVAMYFKGHAIKEIKIKFFSIDIIDNDRSIISYENDLLILISGSIFNFIASLLSMIFYHFFLIGTFKYLAYINMLIGILNLMPISSLDGGQILYMLLSKIFSIDKTYIICEIVSFIFLFPLSVLGFIILLNSKYNFSLLFICCYLIYFLLFKNES